MSEVDFRARLRRLRREEAPRPEGEALAGAPPEAPPAGMPTWLRKRLDRTRSTVARDEDATIPRSPDPPTELIERVGPAGSYCLRELRFPRTHRHGDWSLAEIDEADPTEPPFLTRDPELVELDLGRAVYLDIETNGLAGGAGTIPFMVALGRFDEAGEFVLWQGFLRNPGEERAMLAAAAEEIERSSGVVSFFGKSFDRHRMEDKMRIHGIAPPFDALPHYDLYHPCRRLYGRGLPDGRLATMERELCGVERRGDLPGSFAPAAWLDFLQGRAHRLEAVFQHNADDVLSLVTLAAHLGRTRCQSRGDGKELVGDARDRTAAVAALHREHKNTEDELDWLERARGHDEGCVELRARRARALRRLERLDEALAAWTELTAAPDPAVAADAWIELAKLHEHRRRDPSAALEACAGARRVIAEVARFTALVPELEHREARLRARLER